MFLGINMFRALLRARFNPCRTAEAEMSVGRAQNIFMAMIMNSIVLLTIGQASPKVPVLIL